MAKDDGGPAFPGMEYMSQGGKINPPGMSLRDYFAAAALRGYCGDHKWRLDMDHISTAKAAYHQADAMLAERNKTDSAKT